MKNLISKVLPFIGKLKGKKPIVIIVIAVAIGGGYFAVHKGWISEEVVNIEFIIDEVSNAFESSSKEVIDSVALPVDSLSVEVVDSIANN